MTNLLASLQKQKSKRGRFIPIIRADQRVLLLGKTGSGKSYVARYLLKVVRKRGWRVVIIDPKKDWMGRGKNRRAFGDPKTGGTIDHPVLVASFHPDLAVQIIQPAVWTPEVGAFLMDIMSMGNTFIYFDEGTQLVNANFVPIEFLIPLTQGRSVNVAVWYGTQRPVGIPRVVKDQASAILLFRITSEDDREVIVPYMGDIRGIPELVEEPLPERYFWYYEETMTAPVLVRPLTVGGGANVNRPDSSELHRKVG